MFKKENKGKQLQKHKADVKSNDFYKYYRKHYMKHKNRLISEDSPYYLTKDQYMEILLDFNLMLKNQVIEGKTITIPMKFGNIAIRKHKLKPKVINNKIVNMSINWKETIELWESDESAYKQKRLIRNLNKNSNGFVAKIRWIKDNSTVLHKTHYTFMPCRTFKRDVAKAIKEESKDLNYLEYDNRKQ